MQIGGMYEGIDIPYGMDKVLKNKEDMQYLHTL